MNKFYDFYTNDQLDQASQKDATVGGNENREKFLSYIGRFTYDYQGKYLLDFSGRYDGSYRYHPDQRWGLFPQISLGWRISEENFMKKTFPNLSNLKIRGSYGLVGEDAGAPFQYVVGFLTSGGGYWEFQEGKETSGVASPPIVNERLSWMESKILDIGLDVGLFNNKLSFSFDLYQKTRTGLLAYRNVSLPNTYGGSFPQENLNSDRVKGFEFLINHTNRIGDLSYNISGNINFFRRQNLYIEHSPYSCSWDKYRAGVWNDWFNGAGTSAPYRYSDYVWTYDYNGRLKTDEEIQTAPLQNGPLGNRYVLPGDLNYEDLNGDGVIDGNDLKPMFYDGTPKLNFGLTLNGEWKNFDMSILFQGAGLFSKHYTHSYTMPFFPGDDGNLPAYFMDRWHREDSYDPTSVWIEGEWPPIRTSAMAGMLYQDNPLWRRDATYLRLKNIAIGYTLMPKRKVGINSLRLSLNIDNVYTWTDKYLKPFDPESDPASLFTGWIYPLTRTFNLGLNITF